MNKSSIQKITKVLWATFLVSIPITNFPYFPAALGGSKVSVRPLLIYPLVLLLIIIIPSIYKRKLPRMWIPFIFFVVVVLIGTLIPVFGGAVSEMSELTISSRFFRTIITLFLAAAIYLVVSVLPISEDDLNFSLKWLYIGLTISLIWGSLQLIYVLDLIPNWFQIMRTVQELITLNRGEPDRIIGLTQEPSWFADQLTAVYLPWLLSSFLVNKTVFKRITPWLTFESVLLVWLSGILIFTFSRSGYLSAAVVIGCGVLVFWPKKKTPKKTNQSNGFIQKIIEKYYGLPGLVKNLIRMGIFLLGLGVVLYFANTESPYMARMWKYWFRNNPRFQTHGSKSLMGYIRSIGFGPRLVYWETAYNIFAEYPFLGVGLGNYTFHFQDFMPSAQVGYMPEILKILVPDKPSIITPKNYFLRLLAETGIVGTGAYVVFLIGLFSRSVSLWLSKNSNIKFWGIGALLGIIAFLMNTFSYDSLAIPNPWIVFGLATAAFQIFRQTENENKEIQAEE